MESVGALIERPRAIGDRPYELICSTNPNFSFAFVLKKAIPEDGLFSYYITSSMSIISQKSARAST